jgi:DNA modification methylase
MSVKIHHGDCIETMRGMPDDSVDSIVTDPPYGLGFKGKGWDSLPPSEAWATECLRTLKPGGHLLAFGGSRTWHRLAVAIEDGGFEIRDSIAWLYSSGFPKHRAALKPAFEPIVLARKPLIGTLTATEDQYGTGTLNISGCRTEDGSGRWPANVALDVMTASVLDQQSGNIPGVVGGMVKTSGPMAFTIGEKLESQRFTPSNQRIKDNGGASRFFYVTKASKKERPVVNGIAHPTVKPLALMRWLVRLVTPAGGTVLDPFAGSGTTVEAAILEGLSVIGIEREAEYLPLIEARIERVAA